MLLSFIVNSGTNRSPHYMEAALDALHQSNPRRLPLTLELAMRSDRLGLFCRVPRALKSLVFEELRDAYPGSLVESLPETELNPPADLETYSTSLVLTPDAFPIKTFRAFEDRIDQALADPLAGLFSALRTNRGGKLSARIVLHVRVASERHIRQSRKLAERLQRPFPLAPVGHWHRRWSTTLGYWRPTVAWWLAFLSFRSRTESPDVADKLDRHLFEVHAQILVTGPKELCHRAHDKLIEIGGSFGRFTSGRAWFSAWRPRRGARRPWGRGFLMSAEELATLWHPPIAAVQVERLARSPFREMEPPVYLPSKAKEPDVTLLGRVHYRQQRSRFGMRIDDLRRHLFVCGRTGTGKSTLLKTILIDGLESNRNVCLVDPHGDLVEAVLGAVPARRTNDVVLFDAADRAFPVAFNPLDCPQPELRALHADGLVGALKRLYGDSWGPRLEQILRNGVLLLLERKQPTLIDLQRLLNDASFRTSLVNRTHDPVVRAFWRDTFAGWSERFRAEAVSPVANKIDGFLSNPIARAITCQSRSTIHFRSLMDNPRSVFLCNLSKGLVGEETSTLLGAFLVASLQTAALSRADIPEAERTDVQICIDEFHSFVSEGNTSFATILSESRKYRVAFAALATQFLDQIDEATLAAILGNCGSTVAFRCGVRDAETLAQQLGGDLTPQDILGLPNYTAYARLLVGGEPTLGPFSMTTIPSAAQVRGRAETVRRVSRQRYGRPVDQVEAAIRASLRSP